MAEPRARQYVPRGCVEPEELREVARLLRGIADDDGGYVAWARALAAKLLRDARAAEKHGLATIVVREPAWRGPAHG